MLTFHRIPSPGGRTGRPPVRHPVQNRGFTLIELMIVVAIVVILAAIAYPSYQSQVEMTRRADAHTVLMQAAQHLERVYSHNGCYNPIVNCAAATATCDGTAEPPCFTIPFTKAPIDGGAIYYLIRVTSLSASAFTLTATPQGAQAGAATMTLDNTGARTNWQ